MWPFSNKKYRELQEKVDYLTGQLVIVRLDKDEDAKRVNKLIVDLDNRACALHKRIVDLEERASSLDESASDLDAHIGATSNILTEHIATSVRRMNEISNYQSDHSTGPSHLTSEEASGLKRLLEGERVVDSTIEDLVATDQATDQDLKELREQVEAVCPRLDSMDSCIDNVGDMNSTLSGRIDLILVSIKTLDEYIKDLKDRDEVNVRSFNDAFASIKHLRSAIDIIDVQLETLGEDNIHLDERLRTVEPAPIVTGAIDTADPVVEEVAE